MEKESIDPSLTTLRVWITIFHATAIFSTLFRLCYRLSMHRWWYEDWFAAIGLVADINSFISVWIYTYPRTESNADERAIAYWNVIICFTICIWCSRLSIIFSIIRLSSHIRRIKRIAIWTAVAFGICCVALLTQKSILCAQEKSWSYLQSQRLNCGLGKLSIGIPQLVADFLSDIALVVLPIFLLRGVRLSREHRILIVLVFSSSIVTSLISVVHVVFMWQCDKNLQTITAQLQIAASLIICDLLVIVTYFHRVLKSEDLEHTQDCDSPSSVYLTTMVDFGHHSGACPQPLDVVAKTAAR
ncbi:hypothetical protein M405DRAFT_46247 [Rhizopogon salebrosus TDB-379]|nr:hypothetical protein M405DRAFT_46247 [Rhizopogon salebrosus TDB-379]